MTAARHLCPLAVLAAPGCSSPRVVDPDIVRPGPGQRILEKLPGPLLGPFDSYADALLAACTRILSKPHASAGRQDHQEAGTFWRVSSEYCAWVYYTPDDPYLVSKLTDQSELDPLNRSKTCLLPSEVEDARYPASSIKYVYALHNHPHGTSLTKGDIRFIVQEGVLHGFEFQSRKGTVRLSIVAFYSHDVTNPTCDGFHQYVPVTGQLMNWSPTRGRWKCEQTGRVVWNEDATEFYVEPVTGACFEGTP
ncbi:hypothetical protein JY651_40125 [Pyxidicoccus parkwayensis]|uniref:Lipoprotein n=1 Tax=Pyxidicoccus parkwayensis TaxID=2813578 RepID=A0ABX7NR45_9BACT|nr:hypothetical protein [Pyxidicoccus parkwaysis]QSQ21332.1 hypothetical protein JY651_40125 [Pyxidicoccus parkwaysis]